MRRLTSSQWSAWCSTYRQLRAYSQIGAATAPVFKEELPEVPVEVAALVRRRTLGTVQVPNVLTDAVEAAAAAGSTRSSKLQRWETQQLTDSLKQLSRTPGKGGTTMRLIDANSGGSSGKQYTKRSKKGLSAKQTLRSLRNSVPVSMASSDVEASTQDSGSEDETFWDEDQATEDHLAAAFGSASIPEREPAAHSSPEYDSTRVAAYASSRMPACYAVLYRVFDELHLHLPHFSPKTMLDFGSGPGTAIWAAREVWQQYPQRVTAIEPSAAMRNLAVELQQAQSKQHDAPSHASCTIQWHRQLHPSMLPAKRSKLQQTGRQTFDLVVASYVLTEMQSDAERQQAVDMLWRQTKDVLVLLEPGTPSGSAFVRHARTQILEASRSQHQQAARQQGILDKPLEAGAYVVAPCPHDGQCPMEGTRSWCHFAQRFQRSDLQRRHKVLTGGHGARTYQDERFSYVVMRRGARPGPESIPDLTVARQRQVDPPDAVQRAIEAGAVPRSPKQMPAAQPATADSDASSEEDNSDAESAAAWSAMNLPDMDEATRQLILASIKANAASDEEEDEDDIRQMLNDDSTMLPDADSSESAASAAVNDSPAVAKQAAEEQADAPDPIEDMPTLTQSPRLQAPFRKLDSEILEDYDQWDQEYWRSNMPEAVDATVAAAQIWSRIIRPPRKRGKHIIVDVCSSREHATDADAVDTSHGHLVRQVVATTDKKTWLGPGGYRLARKSRWGDLWPKYYQDYALTHKPPVGTQNEFADRD